MSQSSAAKLISKLRYKLQERRKLSTPEGPLGRHKKIKKTITALFKHERIELNYHRADESRGYAERLISEAIRHGDCHKPTMEMASYWIVEKPIIHKLFKVLAPRYKDSTLSYTKLWRAPNIYPGPNIPRAILELRNNIYPSLVPEKKEVGNQIHNVLLEAARFDYEREKALKLKLKEKEKIKEKNQSDCTENIEAAPVSNVDLDKINATNKENELPSEENLKEDIVVDGEVKDNDKLNFSVEENLDLRKIKLNEEKHSESFSEKEKK